MSTSNIPRRRLVSLPHRLPCCKADCHPKCKEERKNVYWCPVCQYPLNNWEIDRDMVMAGDYLAGRSSEHLNIRWCDNLPYSVTPLYKPIVDTDRSYMVNCTPLVCVRVVVDPSSLSFTWVVATLLHTFFIKCSLLFIVHLHFSFSVPSIRVVVALSYHCSLNFFVPSSRVVVALSSLFRQFTLHVPVTFCTL